MIDSGYTHCLWVDRLQLDSQRYKEDDFEDDDMVVVVVVVEVIMTTSTTKVIMMYNSHHHQLQMPSQPLSYQDETQVTSHE